MSTAELKDGQFINGLMERTHSGRVTHAGWVRIEGKGRIRMLTGMVSIAKDS